MRDPHSSPWVRIGGSPLSHMVDGWGDLTLSYRQRGPWEMSFGMAVQPFDRPPLITEGAPVEALLGPGELWAGEIAEIDWAEGSIVCVGACRTGEEVLCLTAGGATTTTVDVAIDAAIARGVLNWFRPFPISSTPLGDADESSSLNYLTALLDAYEAQTGNKWRVTANRFVEVVSVPTAPTWHVLLGSDIPKGSNEKLAGTIKGRYQDLAGNYQTVTVGTGKPEIGVGLFKHGRMTSTKATTLITNLLEGLGPQFSWSSGIEVSAEQIITPGGTHTPLNISQVWGNQMIRLLGQRSPGLNISTEVVTDEVTWDVTAGTLNFKPVGTVARDLRAAVEGMGGELL